MAAIAYPELQPCRAPRRPHLRVLPPVEEVVRRSERISMAAVYRRRRVAALAVSIVVLAGAITVASTVSSRLSAGAAVPGRAPAPVVEVVQPGDTFWSIAVEHGAAGDVRARVDELIEANGGSASLQVGQRVVIPQ